ncbi:hypothetical protein [Methylobacterium oryzihabitans]|uniref:Uncharacterized protein n=1 Tax=Methylobacterium oryzihabitans TaxID=2499852 RepID=A0A437PE21_9HYPH|nr:hypothetical protein [Methylobacterium oryzihabitans]RVU20525.1 hypothetical protein EOE48_04020 [Methylobacterium oryzihabitans]
MLKSVLSIAVVGLGLKDIRALWALMLVCAATLAGAVHLAVHHGLGWGPTLRALSVLDVIGVLAYVAGIVLF